MKERNSSIDMFRLAAAVLVIVQHYCPFRDGTPAAIWIGFYCRIAVPFFFMISGYFSWKEDSGLRSDYLKKHLVAVGKLLVISAVVIIAFNGLMGRQIIFQTEDIRWLILFNEPHFLLGHSHIWYILALIYVLAAGLVIEKLKLNKAAYWVAPLLLLGNVILDYYLFGTELRKSCYTRNWLLDGLPFFYIGQFIHRYEKNLRPLTDQRRSLILPAVAAVCLGTEGALMLRFEQDVNRNMYFFLPMLSVSVLLALLSFPDLGRGSRLVSRARDVSLVMYVTHHMVAELLKLAARELWGIRLSRHPSLRFILIVIFSGAVGLIYADIRIILAEKNLKKAGA